MPSKQLTSRAHLLDLLQRINLICLQCNESLDPQELLRKSLHQILDFFKSERGSIFLLNPQTNELKLKTHIGMQLEEKREMVKRLGGEGIVEQVAQLKTSLLVDNIAQDKRFKNYKPRKSYQSPSFICSPLLIKNELIGVVNLADKSSKKSFTQRELLLLDFFCNQIAINYHRITMAQELGAANIEKVGLKKQIESQERLVSLGKLAGGIAHEFNNPLDGVMRYTNLSLSHAQDNEVLREYLTEIQQGLKRMANIVKNLLACARNSPSTNHAVDLHKTIEQALKEIYPYLASKNITLVKNFSKEIPEIIDLGIERIISNLVKNAVDAINKNGTIKIETSLEDDYIKILISDTGKGISSNDIGRIFEPFFTTKDIDQGCGLGLTVVHEIVKYYNGKIKVKSHPEKGTTFTVKLPINN